MKNKFSENLMRYNRLDNMVDRIYNCYLSENGISETTMWILYSTYVSEGTSTQTEICENWYCAPQTINSALKVLENKGIVELSFAAGNRKNKHIHLTPKGVELCEKLVKPLIFSENAAFSTLSDEEQEMLISLYQKYGDALNNEIQRRREEVNYDAEKN